MSDVTRAALSSWEWRIEVIVFLLVLGVLYTVGWSRLRRVGKGAEPVRLAKVWRLISYWVGLLLVFFALVSPIEVLSGQLFWVHMVQHLMIAMFAPPLLLAPNPMPVILWGMPKKARKQVGRVVFSKKGAIRPILEFLSKPFIGWAAFFFFLCGWHDPNLYNLTLRNTWAHDLEHLTFFWSAMLLWWTITGAGPVFHKRSRYPARIAFTLACVPANMIAGVVIALADTVIYTEYLNVPFRLFNMDVLDDQRLGGAIMWVPGSMMYVIAVVVLITLWMQDQERKTKALV